MHEARVDLSLEVTLAAEDQLMMYLRQTVRGFGGHGLLLEAREKLPGVQNWLSS